jgi:hypothetical protein
MSAPLLNENQRVWRGNALVGTLVCDMTAFGADDDTRFRGVPPDATVSKGA